MLSLFPLPTIDFQETLQLDIGLVSIHLTAAFIWVVTKFSYLSFGVFLSNVSRKISNISYCYRILIAYITMGKWLVAWVLWHVKLCWLFNAKFCLYVHTFNLTFLNEYFVDKIFDKQDFLFLLTINQFQSIILFSTTLSLAGRTEHNLFWRSRTDRLNYSPWKNTFRWERKLYFLWECV